MSQDNEVAQTDDVEWVAEYLAEADSDGYVPFNHDRRLGQNQYVSDYYTGRFNSPNLGEGLRFKNLDGNCYHSIRIHKDDLLEFHRRVKQYQYLAGIGQGSDFKL